MKHSNDNGPPPGTPGDRARRGGRPITARNGRPHLREADHGKQGGRDSGPASEHGAVANVTEKYRMPMVAPTPPPPRFSGRAEVRPHGGLPRGGLSRRAHRHRRERGLKTIALLSEDTLFPWPRQGTIELAKSKGLQVVFADAYPKGQPTSARSWAKCRGKPRCRCGANLLQ